MKNYLKLFHLGTALFLPICLQGQTTLINVYSEGFESGDGDFATNTINVTDPSDVGEWLYESGAGLNDSAGWVTYGGSSEGNTLGTLTMEQQLISPNFSLAYAGELSLSFDHQYNFEYELAADRFWDGGLVMISVNSGAYVQLDGFSQNGYTGTIQDQFNQAYEGDFNGLSVFGGSSDGWITSSIDLGAFSAGDEISLMFRVGYDWQEHPAGVNWAIDNIAVQQSAVVPEPSQTVLAIGFLALFGFFIYRRRRI